MIAGSVHSRAPSWPQGPLQELNLNIRLDIRRSVRRTATYMLHVLNEFRH